MSASALARRERDLRRGAASPLSDPTWRRTGDAPGWAARIRFASANAESGTGEPSSSSICTASSPEPARSSRGRAASRKIGGSSSSRSRLLTFPEMSTTASCCRTSLQLCQTSRKARTVAVPWKSSTVTFPHSELSFREIWRATEVTTQGSSTGWPG